MKKIFFSRLLILFSCFFLLSLMIGCSSGKQLNPAHSQEDITKAINNDQWIFTADYAMPVYGRSRHITGTYDVRCNKDTLTVALPYFGKQNMPGDMSTQSPLDFRSTDFSLKKEEKKAGQWEITIKPNDYREVQSMVFNLYDNGSAQLNITLNSRSGINFTGNVKPKK